MGVEELLDLPRVHVLATADDHVLDPADDLHVAVLAHHREVPGVHPAPRVDRLGGPLGLLPVPEHHAVAAGAQFARHPALQRHARRRIDDLDLDVRHHPPDRAGPAFQVVVAAGLRGDR